jgi:hypothetical protein
VHTAVITLFVVQHAMALLVVLLIMHHKHAISMGIAVLHHVHAAIAAHAQWHALEDIALMVLIVIIM